MRPANIDHDDLKYVDKENKEESSDTVKAIKKGDSVNTVDETNLVSNLPRLQHVPATINFDGPAGVSKQFSSLIRRDSGGCLESRLRGRPLDGRVLRLPPDLRLHVLQPSVENEDVFKVCANENDVVSWSYDNKDSQQEPLQRALQFIKVAKALHNTDP